MIQYKIRANNTFAPIRKLIDLGGKNFYNFTGESGCEYYFINDDGRILTDDGSFIPSYVREMFLDDFPKRMLVSHDCKKWKERIVICKNKSSYICVSEVYEDEYREGKYFDVFASKYAKEIKSGLIEVTMQDIEEKFGCKIKIVKKTK